jgi:hypothetical protein
VPTFAEKPLDYPEFGIDYRSPYGEGITKCRGTIEVAIGPARSKQEADLIRRVAILLWRVWYSLQVLINLGFGVGHGRSYGEAIQHFGGRKRQR